MRVMVLGALLAGACSSVLGIQSVEEGDSEPDASTLQCGVAPSYGLLQAGDGVPGAAVSVGEDGSIFFGLLLNLERTQDFAFIWLRPGYGPFAAGLKEGEFTIGGDETKIVSCGVCAFLATDFDGSTFTARDFYMATEGRLVLTNVRSRLEGTLHDAKFAHVDLASGRVLDECRSQIQAISVNMSLPGGGSPDAGVPDAGGGIVVGGTAIDTFFTEGGEISRGSDVSGYAVEAQMGNGAGFDRYPGTGKPDGTFSIANLPAGRRYVRFGIVWLDTSEGQLDFGNNYLGRGSYRTAGSGENFHVSLANADTTAQLGDFFEIFAANMNSFFQRATAAGGASLDTDLALARSVEGDKGDVVTITELVTKMSPTGQGYRALTRAYNLPKFSTTPDTTVQIPAAPFATVAQSGSATIDWRRSGFQAAGPAVNPGAVYSDDQFYVFVLPGGMKLDLSVSAAPDLFAAGRVGPGDTNFGLVRFGNPFPSSWDVLTWHVTRFTVPYLAPGASLPYTETGYLSRTDPVSVLGQPLRINLAPVGTPRINDQDAFAPRTGVSLLPLLSWSLPATGAPHGYIVSIYDLANVSGASLSTAVGYIYVPSSPVRLPASLLVAGHTYYARISAFIAPRTNLAKGPFRRGMPNAFSDVLTAPFSP